MSHLSYTPNSSSVIKFVLYDTVNEYLTVQFQTKSIWTYYDVPAKVYEKLITSDSCGNYFNIHVRNKYESEQILAPSQLNLQSKEA